MIKVFNTINVEITVTGKLPEDKIYRKIFYNTAKEAVTNAVRHGYASKIDIALKETETEYSLSITNNGYPPTKPLNEGGGIKEMRRKVEELGGSFSYNSSPVFKVTSVIHKELQNDKSINC